MNGEQMLIFLVTHYEYGNDKKITTDYRNVYNKTLNFYNAPSFINGIDNIINNQEW